MNAIDLLTKQHRELGELFEELDSAGEDAHATRERLCREISDELAVHAEIEEGLFYPESKQPDAEELLRASVEEHLALKRLLAGIIEDGPEDERFTARMKVLEEQLEHHVEEEQELFPKVRRSCSREELEDLGERMQRMAERLMEGEEPSPSKIPDRTDRSAPI